MRLEVVPSCQRGRNGNGAAARSCLKGICKMNIDPRDPLQLLIVDVSVPAGTIFPIVNIV
jgi:hypothetical protein